MRWVFHILILAIVLSGYVAAAHAFEPVSDDQGQVQMVDMGNGCADCPGGNAADPPDQDNGTSKCCDMNCHHCCTGHIGFPPVSDFSFSQLSGTVTLAYADNLAGDFVSSLLRPPRNLA